MLFFLNQYPLQRNNKYVKFVKFTYMTLGKKVLIIIIKKYNILSFSNSSNSLSSFKIPKASSTCSGSCKCSLD